jgi:serine/threonine protein kinase
MSTNVNHFSKSPESEIPPIITPILYKKKSVQEGLSTITIGKRIGKGGYGTVYLCHNDNGEELAVKCIKTKDFGIPSLIEASIMSVIQHPNLTNAYKIHATPQKLYILQQLAISDLRIYRMKNQINEDIYYKWICDIAQGLNCLHRYDIIHGDLKSSNILIYAGGRVKISDFTLSTDKKWKNNYKPCTPTHRPLEVWLGHKWSEKVDIWAFGCTVFEIVYGSTLFVNQNNDASINALIDWHNYLPRQYKSPDFSLSTRDVFHYTFSLPPSFNTSNPVNSLILSSLVILPEGRPSIVELMKSEIFVGVLDVTPIIINGPRVELSPKTHNRVKKILSNILYNNISIEIAYDIYTKLDGMINVHDRLKLITCAWMANKIVERINIPLSMLPFELYEILQMERIICNYLSYRLFCKML